MKNYLNKIKLFISSHKIISIIVLILIILIGYWIYGKITSTTGETRYVTTKVIKGSVIATISGTGQVSTSNQVELKPKVSGDIVYLPVRNGQQINSGAIIAQVDTKNAQKTIRDAEVSLESAKLSLEKLKIQNSNENISADLTKAYSDGFNVVSSVFLDMPSTITELENLLSKENMSDNAARISGNTAINYRNTSEALYYSAKIAYEKNKKDFSGLNYNSQKSDIDSLITETYNTTILLNNAIKNINDYVNYLSEDTGRTSDYTSYQSTLSTYTTTTNEHLSSLLSAQTSIKSAKDSFSNTNIDIQSGELSVKQKENALWDAKDALSDYYIRAPFTGIISNVAVKKSDSVSSGTTIATLITDKQVAEMSLNEIDVAKIKNEQKATITFDAIPDLTISGKVIEVDSVGTVSSGVVSYTVKINFDTNDSRIKPGMSVSATIITDIKQDVLIIPNSAVKSMSALSGQNDTNYVETFDKALAVSLPGIQGSPSLISPNKKNIVVGISSDSMTEIVSGLSEGDIIVTKTITSSNATKTTTTKSILSGVGSRPKN